MSERRLSTVCAVVERPDHYSGDDLVVSPFYTLHMYTALVKQGKPTNCGTKAADVLDKLFSWQTLMRIH